MMNNYFNNYFFNSHWYYIIINKQISDEYNSVIIQVEIVNHDFPNKARFR